QQIARQIKVFSMYSDFSVAGSGSAWVKDGNNFVKLERQTADGMFGGVSLFRLGGDRRLAGIGRAATAGVADGKHWELDAYVETAFAEGGTRVTKEARRSLET